MDAVKFGETLTRLLPSIKTKLQLSGLAIALAFGLFVHFAKPGGDTLALLTAGQHAHDEYRARVRMLTYFEDSNHSPLPKA